jgi:hypothetical protein
MTKFLKQELITRCHLSFPALGPWFKFHIVDVFGPMHCKKPALDALFADCANELDCGTVRNDLIFRAVDDKCRCGIAAFPYLRHGADGRHLLGLGLSLPVLTLQYTVEHERQAVTLGQER